MKKAVIHYFTGTGNAEHAALAAAAELFNSGYQTDTIRVEESVTPPSDDCDIDIFFFSVYSWSAAVMMKRYMRSMPHVNKRKAAIFAVFGTSVPDKGGNPGQALANARAILSRRGYDVFLTDGMRYPVNWIQFSQTPDKDIASIIMKKGDVQIGHFVQKIINGESSFYQCGGATYILTKIAAVMFGVAGRRLMGKFFIADSACTGCGVCAKSCPAHTIKMAPIVHRPYWSFNCENCNRCMNICPESSIQTSILRIIIHTGINIALIVCGITWAVVLTDYTVPDGVLHVIVRTGYSVLIIWLLLMAQGYILDPLLYVLQNIHGVRALFSITFTKRFRRYAAPGFKPIMRHNIDAE